MLSFFYCKVITNNENQTSGPLHSTRLCLLLSISCFFFQTFHGSTFDIRHFDGSIYYSLFTAPLPSGYGLCATHNIRAHAHTHTHTRSLFLFCTYNHHASPPSRTQGGISAAIIARFFLACQNRVLYPLALCIFPILGIRYKKAELFFFSLLVCLLSWY
ncbi:hypothetical protein AOQ84DRAFT_66248 [Glonium stellatum]|uniref:Uncharacterized protein n=1 Tax=Glonium stellatum TaxID=574774 RepID=A0A8E2JS18_9PEZI|nr:hypothetical protein AOQ84DRAFT_66248 [Glonium stellatum]